MRPALAILVAASLACETRATEEPCPGAVQGTFTLVAELVDGAECAAAAGTTGPGELPVSVTFSGEDGAAICLQRPLAEPLVGTRSGDEISVSTPPRSGTARGCACTVELRERISGTVQRTGGVATGFSGQLEAALAPADGEATCAPEPGDACAVPCTVRWTVTAG